MFERGVKFVLNWSKLSSAGSVIGSELNYITGVACLIETLSLSMTSVLVLRASLPEVDLWLPDVGPQGVSVPKSDSNQRMGTACTIMIKLDNYIH